MTGSHKTCLKLPGVSSQKANISRILQYNSKNWNLLLDGTNRKRCITERLSRNLSHTTLTEENYLSFRKTSTDCFKKLSEQKRKEWHNLVNSKTPISQIWALIKCFKRKTSQRDNSSQVLSFHGSNFQAMPPSSNYSKTLS